MLRLSGYRIMWIFTFFDLPVDTKADRRIYAQFRKNLIKDGFSMLQYSVYIRHCSSLQNVMSHINRMEKYLPKKGKVSIMTVTDKQFGLIKNYWGVEQKPPPNTPNQLEMF